jgi:hypothetical protein
VGEQSVQPERKPMSGWVIAVVGLLIAIILGWAMMAIGSRRLDSANKIRSDSEGRLLIAVDFAAQEGMKASQDAQVAINRSNWGQAGSALARVNDLVTLMEQVAPEDKRSAVSDARNSLSDAQKQAGSQSQDAVQGINTLITKLDGLREKKEGQ